MLRQVLKWSSALLCGLLAACAVITVNVYFPEKDVKQAYKSLDEMLLKQGGDTNKPAEGQPAGDQPGTEEKKEDVKPQSRLLNGDVRLSLVSAAYAQEPVADELAIELSSMPEVLKAYDEMRQRLSKLNDLRDSGAVGVSKQGLIVVRDKAKLGGNDALVKAENDNRKTVISSMAKAIEKINKKKQPNAKFNFNQLMSKAAEIYADAKRDEAKPGWWMELRDGTWVRK
ncbi:MAG TPA: DUF1318 domain-containing protein [Geobacteraceae bacterium]|nr:DUF1318 domain-containing protein [Geobacteraceae bacterium]